jgi:hypothetical protein
VTAGEGQADITSPGVLAVMFEPSWDALQMPEEQRERMRSYLRDIAARKDRDAIRRFGALMEEIALDMELSADMAIDTEREIREIAGQGSP